MTLSSMRASALGEPPAQRSRGVSAGVWAIAAGLLGLHAVLAWYLKAPGIGTGNDDAVYVLLARSLRSWAYADLFYVGNPAESQYPPLYPALLAVLGALFGERPTLFVAANITLSVTGLALLFDVVRRQSSVVALLTLAVLSINPLLLSLAGGIRSEPLCMALTGLSLWLLARPASGRGAALWSGTAAIGAALSRSAAVALIAAMGVFWILRRRWGAVAVLGLGSALTVGSWLAWTVVAPRQLPGRSYVADATFTPNIREPEVQSGPREPAAEPLGGPDTPASEDATDQPAPRAVAPAGPPPDSVPGVAPGAGAPARALSTLAIRLRTNIPAYARALLHAIGVSSVESTRVHNLAWLMLLAAVGAVGLWGLRRWWMVAALTLVCHGLLLLLWPYALARYLAPVLPFLLLIAFLGAGDADRWVRGRLDRLVPQHLLPLLLAAGLLVGVVPRTAGDLKEAAACRAGARLAGNGCKDPAEDAFFDATAYIAMQTPDTARVLTAKEAAFYYYAARKVVPIYGVTAGLVPDLRAHLAQNRAEYIYLSHLKLDEWAMVRPLLAMCRELELVRTWGATSVLMRIRDGAVEQPACDAILAYDAAPWGHRLPTPAKAQ